jgi:hypothetical protein
MRWPGAQASSSRTQASAATWTGIRRTPGDCVNGMRTNLVIVGVATTGSPFA